MATLKGFRMGRWLAGRFMKELGLVSCQQPTHRYYHQTNRKTDTGKTLTQWPVLVDHYNRANINIPVHYNDPGGITNIRQVLAYMTEIQQKEGFLLHGCNEIPERPLTGPSPATQLNRYAGLSAAGYALMPNAADQKTVAAAQQIIKFY